VCVCVCVCAGGAYRLSDQWGRVILLTADVRRVIGNGYENGGTVGSNQRLRSDVT